MQSLVRPLVLVALVWAVYANALHGPFTFDDLHVIPNNPAVRGPADVPSFFVDVAKFSVLPGNRDYRPLFLTSMALSWWAGGGDTLPFHLVSVTLHTGNVVMLFLILGMMFSIRGDPVKGFSSPWDSWAAFLAAALFAVHPLATESIDYISSQSVPLAAFFNLLALYLFLTVYGRGPLQTGTGVRLRLAGSCIAFFLALLSKPIAIVLPLLLLLWELTLGQDSDGRKESLWANYWRRLRKHLPYFSVAGLYLVLRAAVSPTVAVGAAGGAHNDILTHVLTQTKAMVFYYLGHAVFPFGQNVDRAYQPVTSLLDIWFLMAVAVFIIIAGLLYRFRRHGNLVFWTLWFPACLLLTTYVVRLEQTVNEHRVYISLMGFCAVIAYLLVRLAVACPIALPDRSIGKRTGTAFVAVLAVSAVLSLGYLTREHNKVWASNFTIWQNAAKNGGTWRAHMNYALALESKGRANEALFQFKEAVRLGPYAFAYLNLGNAQVTRRRFDEGIANLRTAVRLWPTAPEPHLYLGYGLSRIGRLQEAESEMRRAIEIQPNYLKAYRFLGDFLERQGRTSDAIDTLQRLAKLDPSQTWVNPRIRRIKDGKSTIRQTELARRFAAAFSHQKAGRRRQAIAGYRQLLKDQPTHVQGHFNLAVALRNQGQCQSAIKHFERALALRPSYSGAHWHLAGCYKILGNLDKAASHMRIYEGRR